MKDIISFSVRNKLIIALLVSILTITGVYSFIHLPIDAVPDITNNQVQVVTSAPTLAAQEIEQYVTTPVEFSLANLPDMEEIRSISRFGLSVVTVVFKDHVDTYLGRQMVSERLRQAETEIPSSIGKPELAPITTGLGEIYQYTLVVKPGYEKKYSLTDLRTIQDWLIRRQLLRTEGVADISSFGGFLKQHEIAVNPDKLKSFGLSIIDIFNALSTNNANTGGAYIDKKPYAYFIRGIGLIRGTADIENIAVKTTPGGVPVYMKDIASVGIGHAVRYGAMTLADQGETVGGIVLMLKGSNSAAVIEKVKTQIAEIQKTLPEGIVIQPYLDRTKLVNNSIHTVRNNLLEGALIVILVLVLFLGSIRAGLVVASVIPLSMLFAFCMMRLFNVSGNLMSLGALDFGLIVDGAVIIVESILHNLSTSTLLSGVKKDDIIINNSSKMARSAIFGQLIILIVYLPILTLAGIEGKMFKPMAETVAFAIIGAFILSLTYVPAASSLFFKNSFKESGKLKRMIESAKTRYESILNFCFNRKKMVYTFTILLAGVAVLIFKTLGGEFIPTLDEGDFAIETRLMAGSSLSQTVETVTQAGKILKEEFPEVNNVIGKVGTSEIPLDPMPIESCDIIVLLKDKKEWTSATSREALASKMEKALSVIPGVEFGFQQPIQMRFNELITGARQDIVLKIYGEDLNVLSSKANELAGHIKNIPGVSDLFVERLTGLPQIVVRYNREKLSLYKLSIDDVNKTLESSFAGAKAGIIFEGDKRFDLVVRLEKENRKNIEDIRELYVSTDSGQQVPLSEVADVNYEEGPMQISREDTKRRITVGLNVRDRDIESVINDIKRKLSGTFQLPSGYSVVYSGQFENLARAKQRLTFAIPGALILIFLLLFMAFRSVKESLLIFTAIPLSAIGGVFSLFLRNMPFSISAGVGFIALFGVAVLNGIVMISQFKQLEKEPFDDLKDLITQGAKTRLRPVLMTAAVASLGFLPMAISSSGGSEVQRPLATVVIGGLLTSTLLTLILLPLLYQTFNQNKMFKPKLLTLFLPLLLFTQCKEQKNEEVKDQRSQSFISLTKEQYQTTGIKLGKEKLRVISSELKVAGKLDVPPSNIVTISFPYEGIVGKTDALQGKEIKKGDFLAEIEHPEFIQLQQEYMQETNNYELILEEYKRQEELSRENLNSTKVLQQSITELKNKEVKIKALGEKLKLIGFDPKEVLKGKISSSVTITSPIAGYITDVNINKGKHISPSDAMLEIVNTEHLHAELKVFEKDVYKLKTGQNIKVFLSGYTSRPIEAEVYLIGHTIDNDRSVRVHAHLRKEDKNLIPGTYLTAFIQTASDSVYCLPEEAVVQNENKKFVFVLAQEQENQYLFKMKEVKTGIENSGFTEVKNSFHPSEKIVVKGAFYLLSKFKQEQSAEE